MRLIIQLPVILGLCGLLWLSSQLNASWLDQELFPTAADKRELGLAQTIAARLTAMKLELQGSGSWTSSVASASVRK